jgi:hypothetical protein
METNQEHDGIVVSIEGKRVHVLNGMQRLFALIDTRGKAVAISTDRQRVEFTKSDCGSYLVPRLLDQQETLSMSTPTIEQIKALDGKIFAMLTDSEHAVLNFYRDCGRKFGVAVSIINEADPDELARASSREQADQILKRANSRVSVTVSQS